MHPFASQSKASQAARIKRIAGHSGKSGPSNVPGHYARGGAVKEGADEEMKVSGSKPKMRADRYARGGGVKSKKGTQVNIIIAGKGDQQPPMAVPHPVPVPVGAPAMPPRPPTAPPMGAGPMAGPPGGMPPPGMMHKNGGRVGYKRGGMVKHDDEAEDKKLIARMIKSSEKKDMKADKAEDKDEKRIGLKNGGAVKMTAGAESGEGRLEKAKMARRK